MELEHKIRRTGIAGIEHIVGNPGAEIRDAGFRDGLPIYFKASLQQDNCHVVGIFVCRIPGAWPEFRKVAVQFSEGGGSALKDNRRVKSCLMGATQCRAYIENICPQEWAVGYHAAGHPIGSSHV